MNIRVLNWKIWAETKIDKFILAGQKYLFNKTQCAIEFQRVLRICILVEHAQMINIGEWALCFAIGLNWPKEKG